MRRTATCGMTRSTRCAAVSDIRRAPHEGQKPRRVLLHQPVQRGLFRAMALVLNRGAVRRPLGRLADSLHARLPAW